MQSFKNGKLNVNIYIEYTFHVYYSNNETL